MLDSKMKIALIWDFYLDGKYRHDTKIEKRVLEKLENLHEFK